MSTNIDLKELERRAWRSNFEDGLWDIFLGIILAAMALNGTLSDLDVPESRAMPIFIGLEVAALLVLFAGKKFIAIPRMGRIKPGKKMKVRKTKVLVLLIISFVVGVASFIVLALITKGSPAKWLDMKAIMPAIWAANMIVVFGLMAYFFDFSRLYVIAVLYAVAVPFERLLDAYTDITVTGLIGFGVPAAAILLMGAVVLTRFLRDYSVIDVELVQ